MGRILKGVPTMESMAAESDGQALVGSAMVHVEDVG